MCPHKVPRRCALLRFCPACGVRLRLLRGVNNMVEGVEVVPDGK